MLRTAWRSASRGRWPRWAGGAPTSQGAPGWPEHGGVGPTPFFLDLPTFHDIRCFSSRPAEGRRATSVGGDGGRARQGRPSGPGRPSAPVSARPASPRAVPAGRPSGARPSRRGRDELPEELLPTVVLLGRPNVGKSALFNRLSKGLRRRGAGSRGAMVLDTPAGHVTRDYREARAQLGDLCFVVVDTCGLEAAATRGSIAERSASLTLEALRRADAAVLMLDAKTGVTGADEQLVAWLRAKAPEELRPGPSKLAWELAREEWDEGPYVDSEGREEARGEGAAATGVSTLPRAGARLVTVANKAEAGGAGEARTLLEAGGKLGLPAALPISAATGEGMVALFDALRPLLDPVLEERRRIARLMAGEGGGDATEAPLPPSVLEGVTVDLGGVEGGSAGPERTEPAALLRVAVVGVPNAGKSTLVNALAGAERVLTGPEPGLTRDAVRVRVRLGGETAEVVDTAGWVRRARLRAHDADADGALSTAALEDGAAAVRHSDVVVLVVDGVRAAGQDAGPETMIEFERAARARGGGAGAGGAAAGRSAGGPAATGLEPEPAPLGLSHRELTLAAEAARQGRAVVVALNKTDVLGAASAARAAAAVRADVARALGELGEVPVVAISAASGSGLGRLAAAVRHAHKSWDSIIGTSKLNEAVREAKASPAALAGGGGSRDLGRVKFVAQLKARPPTFMIAASGTTPFADSSVRMLSNLLRRAFSLHGTPIRLQFRMKPPKERRRKIR